MSTRGDELAAGLERVRERLAGACRDAGRDPAEVALTVVTKFFPASDLRVLADLGVRDVGENRHQEAAAKAEELATHLVDLGNDGLVVNEINTMPGFTPFSMYPYMWQVSGLGYTELVSELIELSRLQGAERIRDAEPVDVDAVVDEAMRRSASAA